MKKLLNLIIASLLGLGIVQSASAAATSGKATFSLTFVDPPGGFSARVDAFWITDSANKFIKNVRKDAATQQGYLYYWASVRANTTIDGTSGATISSWSPVSVDWDCTDANKVAVPDGTYKFWVEFTDHNGQGWYTTNGIAFTKGTAGATTSYANAGPYLTAMSVVYTPIVIPHDVAVTATTPTSALADAIVPVQVTVANKTTNAESFSVTLSNVTRGAAIGTQNVSLAGNGSSVLTFQWNTAGLTQGSYVLRATAGPVPGETSTTDNTLNTTVAVTPQPHDIAVIAMSPNTVQANMSANLQVTITNKTANAESFSVALSNSTSGSVIGTQAVPSLAGNRSTNVTFVWNTANLQGNYVLLAAADTLTGETATADNRFTNTVAVQLVAHDVAVTGMTPSVAAPNSTVTVAVNVANKTPNAESFAVTLNNLTTGTQIGSTQVSALAGNSSTTVNFQWNTANLSGNYSLRASAGPVTGEVSIADNSFTNLVAVRAAVHDVAVASITAPAMVSPNSSASVTVVVTNAGEAVESFGVQLIDDTSAQVIGTYQVSSLAAGGTANASFAWNTTGGAVGSHTLRAVAAQVAGETATANNSQTTVVNVQTVNHDVGIAAIVPPQVMAPSGVATVTVLVTNAGDLAESFGVRLYDDTASLAIGAEYRVSSLAALSAVSVPFTWNTTNASIGTHTLRAVAMPVAGETALANNTNTAPVAVATGLTSLTLIAKGSSWHYQDQGLDLARTPWAASDYYDAVWNQGRAPLGYTSDNQITNLATTLSWGTTATGKYPAYYFRQEFFVDAQPTSVSLNLRVVDGAVVYVNGVEVLRNNMPAGQVLYSDLALGQVAGAQVYSFTTVSLPSTNFVLGRNVVAVEVHRADLAGTELAFDLELLGTVPQSTAAHRVDAVAISAPAAAVLGDQLPITVTVNNNGNVTETVDVWLRNDTTRQLIGRQTLTGLVPGSSGTAQFNWGTVGAASGANNLTAFTVVNGVTNLAGTYQVNAALQSGFSTNTVNARAGIGGRSGEIAVTPNLMLVGAGATLEVYSRTNLTSPARVGAVRLPGVIQSIAATDTRAFVACGSAGVAFVDLGSSSGPVHRSTFSSSGHAYSVALSGNYAYVADGVAGVRVINATDLAQPTLAGAYYTRGPARGIVVANGRAYVLDQQEGLVVLSLSTAGVPSLLGTYANFDAGQALALSGSYVYLVDGNNHLAVVNAANPSAPALAGSLVLPNVVGRGIAVAGTTAYVAAGSGGLLAIDVTSPAAPKIASTLQLPGDADDLALSGSDLYVAGGYSGVQILDVNTPTQPRPEAQFPVAVRASDVAISGDYAYVASGEAGLRIVNLDSSSPTLRGQFAGAINARAVAVSGTRAYVGDGQYGLKIVNIGNPAAPTLVTAYTNASLGNIRDVGVYNSFIALSDGRTVLVVNLQRSGALKVVGSYQTPAFAFAMAVDSGKAYLACGDAGLVILNLANNLTVAGTLKLPGFATAVAVSGASAYVAGPDAGYWRVDVSRSTSPTLAQTYAAQGPIFDLALAGTNLALVTMTNSIITMNVATPLTPVQLQTYGPLSRAVRLAATTRMTLVAEDEAGLALFGTASQDHLDDHTLSTGIPVAEAIDPGSSNPVPDQPLSLADLLAGALAQPGAAFVLAAPPTIENSALTLRWQSESGRTYTIYRATDLTRGFTVFKDNIDATPPLNVEVDPESHDAAFYVIGVR